MEAFLSVLVALFAVAHSISSPELFQEEWNTFKLQHKKEYVTDMVENLRREIFMENKLYIAKHNAKYEKGIISYKLAINKYGDLLHHEFVETLNGFNRTINASLRASSKPVGAKFIEPANTHLPTTVDWRKKGAVTAVKDQGGCGSCWAFSATGSLEGQHFRHTGVLVSLSEQNLVDCSGKYGNLGCAGGMIDWAFQYIKDNGGIDTEESYPYERQDQACQYDPKNSGAEDIGFVDLPKGNEKKLQAAVATVGPISVAIDASLPSFQFYSEGVYDEPACSSTQLDHGVLIVGYGNRKKGGDYWLVKNSWGLGWGNKGYIKMSRNKNNQCGIASAASYPLV